MSQLVNTAWRKTVDFRQRLDDYIVSNFLRGKTPPQLDEVIICRIESQAQPS